MEKDEKNILYIEFTYLFTHKLTCEAFQSMIISYFKWDCKKKIHQNAEVFSSGRRYITGSIIDLIKCKRLLTHDIK